MSGEKSSTTDQAAPSISAGTVNLSALASQLAQDPTLMAAVQQRCSELVGESSGYIESLPAQVQRRIKALKNLQVEYTKIEQDFFAEVAALEAKFAARYKPLLDRRADIVNGKYEPTDKECEWDSDEDDEEEDDEDDDAAADDDKKSDPKKDDSQDAKKKPASADAAGDEEQVPGIPDFWLTIFRNVDILEDMIEKHDEPLFNHLLDVKAVYNDDKGLDFTLEFHFSENEYMTNKVLTKRYTVECKVDDCDPFSFDGPSIVKTTGCKIDWKKGKNLTVKTVKKKQRHKGRGQTRTVSKTVPNESFFNFFSPPDLSDDTTTDDVDEDAMVETIAADFSKAEFIKDRVIPQAVLYFTGEALEDDDDDGDEEEEAEEDKGSGIDDDYDEDQDPDFDPSKVPQGEKPPECKQQ